MSLLPEEKTLTKEIGSWKGFTDTLDSEGKKLFLKMLNDYQQYALAIKARENFFQRNL